MFGENFAMLAYGMHYREKIGPALSAEQKLNIAKRISDITLYEPLTGKDYTGRFPELAPLVNVPISGLYLVAIFQGLVKDLQGLVKDLTGKEMDQ